MIYDYLMNVAFATEILLFSYFGFAALYNLYFSLSAFMGKKQRFSAATSLADIAIFIPSYKEDKVILETVKSALSNFYPKSHYKVYVVADSLKKETIHQLKEYPIEVIKVRFENSTKAKALNRALDFVGEEHDIAVVLDADNMMEGDFLFRINEAYQAGYVAIQGQRVAKNSNTSLAILDGFSERVNNHIYRKGHHRARFSAALIGSGMAFDFELFKSVMREINAVGGFDKELELLLLKERFEIAYCEDAVVYDEKVQGSNEFKNQRRRWLAAQWHYAKRFWFQGILGLLKGNVDFANKVYQMVMPPRLILLVASFAFFVLYGVVGFIGGEVDGLLQVSSFAWLVVFALSLFAVALALPFTYYSKENLKAVLKLPEALDS